MDDCFRATREALRTVRLVGLSEPAAEAALAREDLTLRVPRRDGEDLPVSTDVRCNRVNVAIADGRITRILIPG